MSVLVHRQHIKKSHSLWSECDFLCLVSKNLYNHCLYNIRQYAFLSDEHNFTVDNNIKIDRTQQQKLKTEFQRNLKNQGLNPKTPFVFANPFVLGEVMKVRKKTGESYTKKRYAFDSTELYHAVKNSAEFRTIEHEQYNTRSINTKILKQTIRQVQQDFSNYFASCSAYAKNPAEFLGKPQYPGYKARGSAGRFAVTVPKEAIAVHRKNNTVSFGGTTIQFDRNTIKDQQGVMLDKSRILEAKIVPMSSGYDVLISYVSDQAQYQEQKKNNKEHKKATKIDQKNTKDKTQEKSKSEKQLNHEIFLRLKEHGRNTNTPLRIAGCDLGVNNLASLCAVSLTSYDPENAGPTDMISEPVFGEASNITPLVVNGRHIKSINQYYNKQLAQLKSELAKNTKGTQKTCNRIKNLTQKRQHKIHTEMHKVSRYIVNWLHNNQIACLVVGKNDGWKQKVNMGAKNNQQFVAIPFAKLISMLHYKCAQAKIVLLTTEESYTSKCSFIDQEDLCSHRTTLTDDFGNVVKHNAYKGKRITRGLFQTQYGRLVNADVNAAGNQIRKVAGNSVYVCCWRRRDLCHGVSRNNIQSTPDSVEAVAVPPVRVFISA